MQTGYPAKPESIPVARNAAARRVRELGGEESVARAVALAVSEACTNVVLHAYRGEEAPGTMTVVVEKVGEYVCVTVLDEGLGIVPRHDSPGMGLGLPLISQFADGVELRSRTDGGAEVSMRFELRRPCAAA